jgi:hypothetical protein
VLVEVFVNVPLILEPLPAAPPVIPPVTVGAVQVYVVPDGTVPLIPFVGVTVNGIPVQIAEFMVVIAGPLTTDTGEVVLLQPVVVEVKVNVDVPMETPVTIPELETEATAGLLLSQVPPVVGDNVVVELPQMEVPPVILTAGSVFTVTGLVVPVHPVDD